MDIFNSNGRLQHLAVYAIDWGIYLRHDINGSIAPFLLLQHGNDTHFRVLMTDGNPVEYAQSVLAQEEEPFEQFVIGFEGYLRDDNNNRVDAIIIQGFDVTQDKGVILAQMFNPKEHGDGFRKINKVTFLGKPELIIDKKHNDSADYSVEEAAITGFSVKDEEERLKYIMAFVHDNPSVIANEIKMYIRNVFNSEKKLQLSGRFELNVIQEIKDTHFLKFLVTNAVNEELETAEVKLWQGETGLTPHILVKQQESVIYDSAVDNPEYVEMANESGAQAPFNNDTGNNKWWQFWK